MHLDTCLLLTEEIRSIAYYSHLVPIALGLVLSIFAVWKTRASKLALCLLFFTLGFSLWLLGDLFPWTSSDISMIYFTWSWLDYINIVFFVLGAYFFGTLCRTKVSILEKIILIGITLPALYLTISGQSLIDFNQPVCEASENELLTSYKIFAEWVAVGLILLSFVLSWKRTQGNRVRNATVMGAILLFFAVFSFTEHIATITDVYEINLYGLFILPAFLIIMAFAITNLGMFELRLMGSQVMAYALIIMVGSQFLFLQDKTESTLSLVTLVISVILTLLLLQNSNNEEKARLRIEQLARDLTKANGQQVILIHFITHQIKGFVTKSRNIFAMMKEGEFGVMPDTAKPMIDQGFDSDTKGLATIQEILNAANIKSGKVSFTMAPFDLKALIEGIANDLKPNAQAKGLALNFDLGNEPVTIPGDSAQLVNAYKNLIDNSIKYTPSGSVTLHLEKKDGKALFTISDTGVGITPEDMKNLFTEGGHGKESTKINVDSTGFGLYIVKSIVEAHKGRVWAESEGAGKGSRFIVELPI